MKLLLVVFLICVHTFFITSEALFTPNFKDLIKSVKNKCVTEDNFNKLKDAFKEFRGCRFQLRQERLRQNLTVQFDSNQIHCSNLNESKLRICLENFTENISPCLSKSEIYLKQFILNAFDAGHEELCGINGVSNRRYIFDIVGKQTETCRERLYMFLAHGTCTLDNIFKHLDQGILSLNKLDVCSDLELLQKCIPKVIKATCYKDFSQLTDLIFDPFLKSCNDLESKK